jgi:hypothetical protein
MPDNIVRVYPASGATALLPMTPANNYSQTVLFCGGATLTNDQWGNYSWPNADTWNIPASNRCHRLEPQPQNGQPAAYVEDDAMLETRTMGQFIILPDGKLLVVNGGLNGTAGYATQTGTTPPEQMPLGMSLAAGPVGQPAIYDPNAPAGKRWSNAGLATSQIARLYHSSAILLPDGSVLIAGSNPNVDVNLTTVYTTTYKAEIFYPPYFSASQRPAPSGVPDTLSYGGKSFDITIPASSYSGAANDAASNAVVSIIRPGFTTHAMNMGQRYLQLNNTYTVNQDGSIALHTSQVPPNANLFPPGPAFLFVTVNGVPSNGSYVIVGNGQIGTQPVSDVAALPASQGLDSVKGSGSGSGSNVSGGNSSSTGNNSNTTSGASHTGPIIGGIIGAVALVGILGALLGICITRRRRATSRLHTGGAYPMGTASNVGGVSAMVSRGGVRNSDSSAFVPLQQDNYSTTWTPNASQLNLSSPYRDEAGARSGEFDPYYSNPPRMSTSAAR